MHNSGELEKYTLKFHVYLKLPYITLFLGRIFVVTPGNHPEGLKKGMASKVQYQQDEC